MSNIAIKAENLSKAYQLGEIGTGTISRDVERWYAKMRGKEDPFLRIGESNDRTAKGNSNIVWSLKDLNFEIQDGAAVGIIGNNGAGKSTLLKILSKVTSPSSGKISGKGRIASLLEVGTGFHPELSGRENIFLNGAILGMRKKEIQRKFDEIVDFAGIERYVDTPVKRYSSGMYVRLAFSVAAHLESEILIVDEVLAVGDADFQRKCLGKMDTVSKGEGRTVLFVSHNMTSIQKLCGTSIVLNNGTMVAQEKTSNAINIYQNLQNNSNLLSNKLDDNYQISNISFEPNQLNSLSDCTLSFEVSSKEERKIESIAPIIYDNFNQKIALLDLRNQMGVSTYIAPKKNLVITLNIKKLPLIEGEYVLGLHIDDSIILRNFDNLHRFNVWPTIGSNNEIAYEYETTARGMINLDFDVLNNVN